MTLKHWQKSAVTMLVFLFLFLFTAVSYAGGGFRVEETHPGPNGVGFVDVLYNDKGDCWLIWWKNDHTIIKAVYIGARDTSIAGVKEARKPSRRDIEDALRRHGSRHMAYPPEINVYIQRHLSRHTLGPIWNPAENARGAPGSMHAGERPNPSSLKNKARRGRHSRKQEDLGKNNIPTTPTQPGFGGMGTRDDQHPERVNPVPELFRRK